MFNKLIMAGVNGMDKKVVIGSIFVVLMLVTITYASAATNNTAEEKESPLYGIRARRAINEKVTSIIENIKTRFLSERIFFLPFRSTNKLELSLRDLITDKTPTELFPGCYLAEKLTLVWWCRN